MENWQQVPLNTLIGETFTKIIKSGYLVDFLCEDGSEYKITNVDYVTGSLQNIENSPVTMVGTTRWDIITENGGSITINGQNLILYNTK